MVEAALLPMERKMTGDLNEYVPAAPELEWEANDDADEIRYSLTALGEAALARSEVKRGTRFRGFGPCAAVA